MCLVVIAVLVPQSNNDTFVTCDRYKRQCKAQAIWYAIIESQIETGTPYMLYKDACNRKSNQQNLGTIKCSNLCTEIVEYSSPEEVTHTKHRLGGNSYHIVSLRQAKNRRS